MNTTHRPGTKVTVKGSPAIYGYPGTPDEVVTIARPRANQLPLPGPGWVVVTFADKGQLCVHESRFIKVPKVKQDTDYSEEDSYYVRQRG
jgi:hypothetical protein